MARDPKPVRPRWQVALRLAGKLLLVLGFAYGLHLFIEHTLAEMAASGQGDMIMLGVLTLIVVAYAFLIAIPFVPGLEIGVSLLVLRGYDIAPYLYVATVAGLLLAYAAGRFVPHAWLIGTFEDLRMARAAALIREARPLSPNRRLALLRRRLPRWIGNRAVRHRYLLLAALINLPGSAVIGGGGGICLVAGFTRLFAPLPTMLTVALAVAPAPLVIWVTGYTPGFMQSP